MRCFNPRAPCGARRWCLILHNDHYAFQSTRPVRGATSTSRRSRSPACVSIHAPRAGRDQPLAVRAPEQVVSIHAPRAGRDAVTVAPWTLARRFQSTRPVRGATRDKRQEKLDAVVSIHAPRAGRDRTSAARSTASTSFNPRAPCGARHDVLHVGVRGGGVSIHAPRAGRDRARPGSAGRPRCFNPRAPCGARPVPAMISGS